MTGSQLSLLDYTLPPEATSAPQPAQTFSIAPLHGYMPGDLVCIISVGHPLPELLIGRQGSVTRIITPTIVQVETMGVVWTLEATNLEKVDSICFRHAEPEISNGARLWAEAGLRYFEGVEWRFAGAPHFASLVEQAEQECDRLRQILGLKPDWEDF